MNRLWITDMELFNLKIHINFQLVQLITSLQKFYGIPPSLLMDFTIM